MIGMPTPRPTPRPTPVAFEELLPWVLGAALDVAAGAAVFDDDAEVMEDAETVALMLVLLETDVELVVVAAVVMLK